MDGNLKGEALHNSRVRGGSGGKGGSPSPQEMRAGLGGQQPSQLNAGASGGAEGPKFE